MALMYRPDVRVFAAVADLRDELPMPISIDSIGSSFPASSASRSAAMKPSISALIC